MNTVALPAKSYLMRLPLSILAILIFQFQVLAQINTVDQQLLWLGIGVDADINSRLSVGVFSEERRFIFPMQRQQRVLIDMHATYAQNTRWTNKVGLWLFEISDPQNPFDPYVGEVKETRPYHVLSYTHQLNDGYKWQFAVMSEYRIFRPVGSADYFGGETFRSDLRERLKLTYSVPLSTSTRLNLTNELHLTVLSTGEQPVFNQNRIQAILKHHFGKGFSVSGGYIFWFQPTGNTAEYFARHIASLRLNYRFKI